MTWANRKLKKVLGKDFSMAELKEADVRPGGWKSMLKAPENESDVHKGRHVPVVVDDAIVQDVADGKTDKDMQEKYGVRVGYVRDVLTRRFGSVEGMKKALQAQCLENAIALNEHGARNIASIPAGQAFVGAKVMIDGALALEKSRVGVPTTVDFEALGALGSVLERIEKRVSGTDKTVEK